MASLFSWADKEGFSERFEICLALDEDKECGWMVAVPSLRFRTGIKEEKEDIFTLRSRRSEQ
jgi:hypothetical protein